MRKITLLLTALAAPLLSSCIIQVGNNLNTTPKFGTPRTNYTYENLGDGIDSPSKAWDKAEVQRQISGKTFLRNFPKRQNEILYFGTDNTVYQWLSGSQIVAKSTWSVETITPMGHANTSLYICTTLQNTATPVPGAAITRRCIEPALLFIAATEHAKSDVFALTGRITSPGSLTIEKTSIDSIKNQLAQ